MPRMGSTPLSFPEFKGATRQLVLVNLGSYFVYLLLSLALPALANQLVMALGFIPSSFLHGLLWQPLTYSFVHTAMIGTLFELLSLWFLASFLENFRGSAWVMGLYAASVVGTAISAAIIFAVAQGLGHPILQIPLMGCMGGIFGLLIAIGVLYGDIEFLLFFAIGIKAKYLAIIYALISFAMLFSDNRMYAFAQLGGALAGLLFVRLAPSRGVSFALSEKWYGLRNGYYRWKRRRAGRKFEVYMRKQGRTVRFDGNGRPIEDDPNDRSRWN